MNAVGILNHQEAEQENLSQWSSTWNLFFVQGPGT